MPVKSEQTHLRKSRTRGKYDRQQNWPAVVVGVVSPEPGRVFYMQQSNPKWQQKRLRIFERDGWACQRCYDTTSQLEVHHLIYRKIDYWRYPDDELITLCRSCHHHETDNFEQALKRLLLNVRTSGLLSDEINALADYHKRRTAI